MNTVPYDVIIVGGGFAGLSAARALRRKGVRFILLEARDRVGGRAFTRGNAEQRLDMGAQWIGPGQPEITKIAAEFAFAVNDRPSGGRDIHYLPHADHEGPGTIPERSSLDIAEALEAVHRLDELSQTVDLEHPARSPQGRAWDCETIASWSAKELKPDAVQMVLRLAEGFLGLPEQISFLHTLFYARANGGFASLLGIGGILHDSNVLPGGLGSLAQCVAADLGDAVRTGQEVTFVRQDRACVSIVTRAGGRFQAKAVILAVPPIVASTIAFEPALPPVRACLQRRFTPFSRLKFHVVYRRAFWRDKGLSGHAGGGGFITFDGSTNSNCGVMTGFFGPREALEIWRLPQNERARLTLARLAQLFGPQAKDALGYEDMFWLDEPFSQGCVAAPGPGVWTNFGAALRAPCDRIIWAGTETSISMPGQVEGAVASGLSAADQIQPLLER